MQPLFPDKNVSMKNDLPSHAVWIPGDLDSLRRLVAILLDNALKYSSPEGVVTIAVHAMGQEVSLEVSDTGCGIPADALNRIFDRFYRVDASRDRKSGGYGLGLAIAQQIARQHGGQIVASSRIGQGSIFRFSVQHGADQGGVP